MLLDSHVALTHTEISTAASRVCVLAPLCVAYESMKRSHIHKTVGVASPEATTGQIQNAILSLDFRSSSGLDSSIWLQLVRLHCVLPFVNQQNSIRTEGFAYLLNYIRLLCSCCSFVNTADLMKRIESKTNFPQPSKAVRSGIIWVC